MAIKAQWWLDPTTADQCGQNPGSAHSICGDGMKKYGHACNIPSLDVVSILYG